MSRTRLRVAVLLLGLVTWLRPALAEAGSTCNGLPATIIGTSGNDQIEGTAGDDVIVGLRGHDHIYGLDGNDVACGGRGADVLYGDGGRDRVIGGPGASSQRTQTLWGGAGNDLLIGGPHADNLYDDSGTNVARGGDGVNRYGLWSEGDDRIYGGDGQSFVNDCDAHPWGAGDDYIELGESGVLYECAGSDVVIGTSRGDHILTGPGGDRIRGKGGDDLIDGEDGNDRIFEGPGVSHIYGDDGEDYLDAGSGRNRTMDGGLDFDVCVGSAYGVYECERRRG